MLGADAVVNATEPCFEIGEHEVNDGQEGLGNLHVTTFSDGGMKISSLSERRLTAPVVGDGDAWRNDALDEATQLFGTSVWHHREPNTSGVPPSPALVEAATGLAVLFDLDRTGDENHVVNASALAASTAADVGFIGLGVFAGGATNPILVGTHHAAPQFVKNLESRLVARQSKLPLKLDGRHAGRVAGDQVGRPEPHRERCMRTFHDGACNEARVAVAMTPDKHGTNLSCSQH